MTGCSLKAYRSELVEDMHLYGWVLPANIEGGEITELPVRHHVAMVEVNMGCGGRSGW